MFKLICFIFCTVLLISSFKLIKSNPILKQLNSSVSIDNIDNYPIKEPIKSIRSTNQIEKRSANFFEDDDLNKSNNVDYIDFSNMYKDEIGNIKRENLEQESSNKKRTIKRRPLRKKKRRKNKRKHKRNRFKRKMDNENKLRVSLKSTNSAKDETNQLNPEKNLISLHYEDQFHRLVQVTNDRKAGNIKLNNKFGNHKLIDENYVNKGENVFKNLFDQMVPETEKVNLPV